MRVLFVAPPFAGHLDRLVPLMRAAEGAGHVVRVLTGHQRLACLGAHGFDAAAPPSLPEGALEQIAEGYGRISGRPFAAWAQLRANLELLPATTADLVAEIKGWRADVLVADSVALMAAPAAARTEVPWITTIASPVALHTEGGTPGYMGGWAPPHGKLGHLRDAIGRAAQGAMRRAVFTASRNRLPAEIKRPFRADGTETIYSPQALLGFGMAELEFPRAWPASFEMIGPLAAAPLGDPPVKLPPARRRIFVTLGTHLPWARAAWRAAVTRLAAERPDWLFVMSEGRMADAGGPALARANLMIVPRLCYVRDLGQFDAVIHHGGTGIAYSAMSAGLPSLVVPQDFDQFDMAARVAWHGLGVRARKLDGSASLLDRLVTEDWPAVARFQRIAAGYDSQRRFLEALDRVTAHA